MGFLISSDLLSDVSFSLIQTPVFTSSQGAIAPGVQTVSPYSMQGIYVGAQLVVGPTSIQGSQVAYGLGYYGMGYYCPTGVQEVVTVTAVTASTFTAAFLYSHPIEEPIFAPTFPLGQPDHVLFTQAEMLDYLADTQKDFLLKTRLIYTVLTNTIPAGTKYFSQPGQAIRVERVSINGYALYSGSQTMLDLMVPTWTAQSLPQIPDTWFLDQSNTGMMGFATPYAAGGPAEFWFSDRGPDSLTLNSQLLVPDAFAHALKYGVLNRAFSKDGEMRDDMRATYCKKRFDLVVILGVRFMMGVQAAMQKQQANDQRFSPMAVQQQPAEV